MERKTRIELATLALARRCSTPEPLPHVSGAGGGNSPDTLCLASLSLLRCDCRHLAARKSTGLSHDARALSGSIPCFLELVEGIPQTLCVWRLCHCSAVTKTSRCSKVHRIFSQRSIPFGFDSLFFGAGGGNRTPNLLITNQLLYR